MTAAAAVAKAMAEEGFTGEQIARVLARMDSDRRSGTREGNARRQREFKARRAAAAGNANNAGNAENSVTGGNDENDVTGVTSRARETEKTNLDSKIPSEPTVPQGGMPSPLDENQKTVLFSAGLRWLGQATGKSEQQLRPLVGRMLRDIGGDSHAAQLVGIFRDAKNQEKADPISWIQAVIRSRGARAVPTPDGAAAVIRKIHENLNAPRNHPDDPSWQAGAPAAGAAPRLASPHERDRDRPERPYLDLVAASGK